MSSLAASISTKLIYIIIPHFDFITTYYPDPVVTSQDRGGKWGGIRY